MKKRVRKCLTFNENINYGQFLYCNINRPPKISNYSFECLPLGEHNGNF